MFRAHRALTEAMITSVEKVLFISPDLFLHMVYFHLEYFYADCLARSIPLLLSAAPQWRPSHHLYYDILKLEAATLSDKTAEAGHMTIVQHRNV